MLVENGRAVGLRYGPARASGNAATEVRARREVVLAAGAVQSPQLLELSGIGQPDLLRTHGIPVVHELPGVGENYRDHYLSAVVWRVRHSRTLNENTRGARFALAALQYAATRRGAFTCTAAGIAHAFVRTSPELETPDLQFDFAHASHVPGRKGTLEREPGMTLSVWQLRPDSRGSIHITRADPTAPPAIRPNFLSERADRDALVEGIRIARRIGDAPSFARYRERELRPGAEVRTYDEILDFCRRAGSTVFHPIGTCKMGSDTEAVVDERLRVRGLEGLRVADASIMPTQVSGNTNAPAIMIGEKGAAMILEDR